eukprot:3828278-Prymnesium_polylepis.4
MQRHVTNKLTRHVVYLAEDEGEEDGANEHGRDANNLVVERVEVHRFSEHGRDGDKVAVQVRIHQAGSGARGVVVLRKAEGHSLIDGLAVRGNVVEAGKDVDHHRQEQDVTEELQPAADGDGDGAARARLVPACQPSHQPQPLPRLPVVGRGHDGKHELERHQRGQVDEQAAVQQVVERNVLGPQLESARARHDRRDKLESKSAGEEQVDEVARRRPPGLVIEGELERDAQRLAGGANEQQRLEVDSPAAGRDEDLHLRNRVVGLALKALLEEAREGPLDPDEHGLLLQRQRLELDERRILLGEHRRLEVFAGVDGDAGQPTQGSVLKLPLVLGGLPLLASPTERSAAALGAARLCGRVRTCAAIGHAASDPGLRPPADRSCWGRMWLDRSARPPAVAQNFEAGTAVDSAAKHAHA